jgi:hypothetical protein
MFERIILWVVIAAGSGMFIYTLVGRVLGFHRSLRWQGGGQISCVGEVACATFVLSGGLCILHSPGWLVIALLAWIIGFVSQERANRRFAAEELALRTRNASHYPGFFDESPPNDIDNYDDETFELFDVAACTYLGRVTRPELQAAIDAFADAAEQGPNDIYVMNESLEMIDSSQLSEEFISLLDTAFEDRDYLVLRWWPSSYQPAQELESI